LNRLVDDEQLIAIILAGGYGTRLNALSKNLPKPLLKAAEKPMIEHIFDRLAEIEEIKYVIISTNLRFRQMFQEWLWSHDFERKAKIVADKSRSEEEKPGAIASLAHLTSGMDDDYLIIAGDNLFTSSLKAMFRTFRDKSCPTVGLYDVKDRSLAKQYSVATVDAQGKIISLNEKPANPETTLIGTCVYMLPKRTVSKLREYLTEAADHDSPGRFIGWLCRREPVYGHILEGHWWDIGTVDQYYGANQTLYVERVLSPDLLARARPSVRRLKELMPVLYDADSCRGIHPELPMYEVYRDLCGDEERDVLLKHGLRYDVMIMPPLMLGEEYVKTMGHKHLPWGEERFDPEIFEVLEGEARFLIQRYQDEELVDVSLVEAQAGDKVLAPPNCGHVIINASSSRLVTGNLISRFCLQTYRPFIERRGGAYYLLKGGRLLRNENYHPIPRVRVLKVEDLGFVERESGLLASFVRYPQLFDFLNNRYDLPQIFRSPVPTPRAPNGEN